MWRPFPNLSRRVCGSRGSFKEYHGLFSVFGALAALEPEVIALIYIRHLYLTGTAHWAGRQCPLVSPCGGSLALRQAKQDSKLWFWTKVQLLATAFPQVLSCDIAAATGSGFVPLGTPASYP